MPLYACHLRAGLRHTTYHIFFEQLLAQVRGCWEGLLPCAGRLWPMICGAWHASPCPASRLKVCHLCMAFVGYAYKMMLDCCTWKLVASNTPACPLDQLFRSLHPTQQGTMEECRAAYSVADEWFSFWRHGDVVLVRLLAFLRVAE